MAAENRGTNIEVGVRVFVCGCEGIGERRTSKKARRGSEGGAALALRASFVSAVHFSTLGLRNFSIFSGFPAPLLTTSPHKRTRPRLRGREMTGRLGLVALRTDPMLFGPESTHLRFSLGSKSSTL